MASHRVLARLRALGPLSDATAPAAEVFSFSAFDELVQQLTAPPAQAHAIEPINLGPPPTNGSLVVELSLVQAVKLLHVDLLDQAVLLADGTEVKRIVIIRLANYLQLQKRPKPARRSENI